MANVLILGNIPKFESPFPTLKDKEAFAQKQDRTAVPIAAVVPVKDLAEDVFSGVNSRSLNRSFGIPPGNGSTILCESDMSNGDVVERLLTTSGSKLRFGEQHRFGIFFPIP